MSRTLNARVVLMHDVESVWNTIPEFIPRRGELIIYDVDDTHEYPRFKIGDGSTGVVDLPFGAEDSLNGVAVWDGTTGIIDSGRISSYR